jgi:hypothetical protein
VLLGKIRADPTRSARWPAAKKFVAFLSQIAPVEPFLPVMPANKYFAVYNLRFPSHLDTEEVVGSNPIVPTIFIINSLPKSPSMGAVPTCRGDVIPLLLHIADKPTESIVTFECDPRLKAGRRTLSVDSGINNGPVVSIDPVGVVENFTYEAEIGIC